MLNKQDLLALAKTVARADKSAPTAYSFKGENFSYEALTETLRKELGLSDKKHTTDDMLFTVETVSCLGACGLAPAVMVNEVVHGSMTPEKAIDMLNKIKEEEKNNG